MMTVYLSDEDFKRKKQWKRVTICLPEKTYRALREAAGQEGISMSEVVRKLFAAYIKEKAGATKST